MTRQIAKRFAAPLDLTNADEAFRQRFWSKVDVRGPDDCWEWTRYRKPNGYGQFTLRKGVFINASRVALALQDPICAGVVACHTCDNPPCCNPAHLFAGTQVDNTIDCVEKGRANRSHGTAHRDARLSPEVVRRIRSADLSRYGSKSEMAREVGVSLTAIRRVLARKTWRHVA